MFRLSSTQVLVVGAGPVGLFAALCLARRGEAVRVIDRGVRTNHESYALALQPSTLHLLDSLELLAPAVAQGRAVNKVRLEGFPPGTGDIEFHHASTRHPWMLILPQSRLERMLVAELERLGVEVEWNRALAECEVTPEGIIAHVDHLGEQAGGYAVTSMSRVRVGSSRIKAQYLIGADGLYSTVRRMLKINPVYTGSVRHFEVFEFDVPDGRELDARLIRSESGLHCFWPLPDNRVRWTFEVPEPSSMELGLDDLAEHFHRESIASEMPLDLRWCSAVSFRPMHAESFGHGRTWLAGDAAHHTLPHGVQSMNAGLLEAALLASRIADTTDSGLPVADLSDYAQSRLAEWHWLLGVGESAEEQERRALIPGLGRFHREQRERLAAALIAG